MGGRKGPPRVLKGVEKGEGKRKPFVGENGTRNEEKNGLGVKNGSGVKSAEGENAGSGSNPPGGIFCLDFMILFTLIT